MRQNYVLGMLLSLGLAACGNNGGGSATAQLKTVGGSGESGSAVLTDEGNSRTQVVINVSGGNDPGQQSAHIHIGTCGSNGSIFAPLNSVQGGTSTSMVSYALSSLTGGRYYINIHKSTDINTIMACGNIP